MTQMPSYTGKFATANFISGMCVPLLRAGFILRDTMYFNPTNTEPVDQFRDSLTDHLLRLARQKMGTNADRIWNIELFPWYMVYDEDYSQEYWQCALVTLANYYDCKVGDYCCSSSAT